MAWCEPSLVRCTPHRQIFLASLTSNALSVLLFVDHLLHWQERPALSLVYFNMLLAESINKLLSRTDLVPVPECAREPEQVLIIGEGESASANVVVNVRESALLKEYRLGNGGILICVQFV